VQLLLDDDVTGARAGVRPRAPGRPQTLG
jgi:hypothetical protein